MLPSPVLPALAAAPNATHERTRGSLCADQVLCVIQECVYAINSSASLINRNTRIDLHLDDLGDSFGFEDLSNEIKDRLGVDITDDDWEFLAGHRLCKTHEEWEARYAPFFTYGRLADFLIDRLWSRTVQPLTILGAKSRAAGAFRRIQEIVHDIRPGTATFGPSTRITDRLTGRPLRRVWEKLRIVSLGRIPALKTTRAERTADFLFGTDGVISILILVFITFIVLGRISGLTTNIGWGLWLLLLVLWGNSLAFVFAVVALIAFIMFRRMGSKDDQGKLPQGIETFRDLAHLIAGDRGGWCSNCGYDLTGLTTGRCPECGTDFARAAPHTTPDSPS